MFALTDADLKGRILGCADGPASFNAEAARRGTGVVSVDPLYRFSASDIHQRIALTRHRILEQTRLNAHEFVWDAIPSIEALDALRMDAMQCFLADFQAGKRTGRYLAGELPSLPFRDGAFDLALCSHFLFLYTEQLTAEFHRAAVAELRRVAAEVRIFPLIALGGRPSSHVEQVLNHVRLAGCSATVEPVPYEFQRGADRMLRISG
jgi:hypothetical protein